MSKPRLTVVLLLAACASPPAPDPSIEQSFRDRERELSETTARRETIQRVLNDLDKTLDKYTEAVMTWGGPRSIDRADKIESFLRKVSSEHFAELVTAADNADIPRYRAIAVAALGFSARPDALDPILNAAADGNPEVVNNAVFGLAVLQDPRTPPTAITRVINDEALPMPTRAGAAWALYRLQLAVVDQKPIAAVWREVVARPIDATDPAILVSAIRGIGYHRDPDDSAAIERYTSHPTPMVRQTAAIALGRLGNPSAVESLLTLIGTAEANENVRLASRKALQALAGSVDRGYDVAEWRRVFERNS